MNPEAALYAALAKAQGSMSNPTKNREVSVKSDRGAYKFAYATLDAILDGCTTDKELQQRLNLSRSTIGKHLVHIYRKIGVFGRTGLVIDALREQWLAEEAGVGEGVAGDGTDDDKMTR